jgi:hypothetical protein
MLLVVGILRLISTGFPLFGRRIVCFRPFQSMGKTLGNAGQDHGPEETVLKGHTPFDETGFGPIQSCIVKYDRKDKDACDQSKQQAADLSRAAACQVKQPTSNGAARDPGI